MRSKSILVPMARIWSLKKTRASTVSPVIRKYRGKVSTMFTQPLIMEAWRGARGADQDAFKKEHHHEESEESVTVLGDSGVCRGHQIGPVQIEVPAEEDVLPTRGDEVLQRARGDLHHGDDAHGEGRYGKDAELQHFRDNDAEHAALDDVKGGDGNEQE